MDKKLIYFSVKQMIFAASLAAIGVVLPLAFHGIPGAGMIFLPMHLPVLLAGLICVLPLGLLTGILTPILSHFIIGMPPAPILPAMVVELAAYGAAGALLIRFVRTKDTYLNIHISLLGAMLIGRVVFGLINALILNVGGYSMQIWLTAAFVTALPGIVIQIVLIPIIVITLWKAKLIEI